MKLNISKFTALSAGIMLGIPWLAVTFAPGDAGMAVCFVLFYALNPAYLLYLGIQAGKQPETMRFQPLLASALFLLGAWVYFDPREVLFLIYAGIYLAIGIAAMAVTALLEKKKKGA